MPIAGLALAGWVGRETRVDDGAHAEADEGRGLYAGAGMDTALFVTGGIVAAYIVS